MPKTRVLGIAPYEGMGEMMVSVAKKRSDIDLTVMVGDLKAGADFVRANQNGAFDVVLSRGGTAKLIREVSLLPVAEIHLSMDDMVNVIRLAKNYAGKTAIVGFPGVIARMDALFDLMGYKIETFTIKSADEVDGIIASLKASGYSLVVGDSVAVLTARARQINGILITSGEESIGEAFDEAIALHKANTTSAQKNRYLRSALAINDISIAAFDSELRLLYSTLDDMIPETIQARLTSNAAKVAEQGSINYIRRKGDRCFKISGSLFPGETDGSILISIKQVQDSKAWSICRINAVEPPENGAEMMEPLDNIGQMEKVFHKIALFARALSPVLITAEEGSDDRAVALALHKASAYSAQVQLEFDASTMDKKQFRQTLLSEDSPLAEKGVSIYFKDVDKLDAESQAMLVDFIRESKLNKRCFLIFSCHPSSVQSMESPLIRAFLEEAWQTNILSIPALASRREDIPSLVSLYINHYNYVLGRQLAGISDEGLMILSQFNWPQNIAQLRRIVHGIILHTNGREAGEQEVASVLYAERLLAFPAIPQVSLEGTLEEITRAIVRRVLEEEDMNQSKAAKRLGISRSTVWRMLK
jgi:hypothetical protein